MDATPTRRATSIWPAVALVALGLALATGATLGPLLVGAIDWRVSANSLNQTFGADGAALVLLAPACLAAAWWWRRGDPVAARELHRAQRERVSDELAALLRDYPLPYLWAALSCPCSAAAAP